MLAAYAAGEQIVSRQIIEKVAENLDLLPNNEALKASETVAEKVAPARVLKPEAREELWNNQTRTEQPKAKTFQTENTDTNGNSNTKKPVLFDNLDDDDLSLEIEEVGGFY